MATVAVLIPCFNEVVTIGRVVTDFRRELPDALVFVFDNNSTDGSEAAAAAAGARVVHESRQGKGFVIAAMLEKVEADVYIMVDGDATYPAGRVHDLIQPLIAGRADHVVGARQAVNPERAYRPLHSLGNRLVTYLVNRVFGTNLQDVMSGYRAFTREVARGVPVLSRGFDVETEFTLQSLEKGFRIEELPVDYVARPKGSQSKLSTFGDGFRVLRRIVVILKDLRPFSFFATLAGVCSLLSIVVGWPPVHDYLLYKYVYHVPLAVLAGFLGLIAIGLLGVGTILSTINFRFREIHALGRRDHARSRPAP
jgi:glycosyltransferase involved in cell wall biosynthesis